MINYAYAYAEIDNATNMCLGVVDTSDADMAGPAGVDSTYVSIPEYNEEYLLKYYDFTTGKWYYDEAMTEEYIPA